jgi:hypothetical protein
MHAQKATGIDKKISDGKNMSKSILKKGILRNFSFLETVG